MYMWTYMESDEMNITMLHDLDTGFLAATLKPAFEALGHHCTVLQTIKTYLEGEGKHIDYLLSTIPDNEIPSLTDIYKQTDFFIVRSITDFTLRIIGVLPFLNQKNMIFKVHGSELREKRVPYSLRTWRINWHGKEPLLCGPRDPSLFPFYRENTITHIERPCDSSLMPKRQVQDPPFALHTPTNMQRKGTQELLDTFTKQGTLQLEILSGISRQEVLQRKAQASFFIDHIGSYPHGPYGMNSVEAWYMRLPVWSNYTPIDTVVCPELPTLSYKFNIDTIAHNMKDYIPDKKHLATAYRYAHSVHDPLRIAQQYLSLSQSL